MTLAELVTARNTQADVTDTLVEGFETELREVLLRLERRLRPLVEAAASGSRTAVIRTARAAALRRQIQDVLTSAGYADLAATATSDSLDPLIAAIEQTRLAIDVGAFTTAARVQMDALQALAGLDLLDQGEATAQALWRTLIRGVFAAQRSERIFSDLADQLDTSVPRIRTLYDTTVSIFTRQAEQLGGSDEDDAAFAYFGPVDSKIRPFCAEHVGKVYTRAVIDALDNGQLPNVMLTGGGYNCRHSFLAISQFSELRGLVNTGQRMPEIQAPPIATRKAA